MSAKEVARAFPCWGMPGRGYGVGRMRSAHNDFADSRSGAYYVDSGGGKVCGE